MGLDRRPWGRPAPVEAAVDFVQENLIDPLSHILSTYVLIYLLLGAGLYFTFPGAD